MAYYRTVNIDFWQDVKIVDNFTPEDKYFMLYLLTNPKTNLVGCYELSFRTAAIETGYNKETIERLIDRFKNIHKVIDYDQETKELIIFNWHKYNWTKSEDLKKGVFKSIEKVKSAYFREVLEGIIENNGIVPRPSIDHRGTSVTVTVTDTVSDTDINKEIVDYLNEQTNSKYKHTTPKTKELIKARIKEGFSLNDFKQVIDNKVIDWKGKEWEKFLTPTTLFGTKFEGYLNQNPIRKKSEVINLPFGED